MQATILGRASSGRAEAEAFLKAGYAQAYGAQLENFPAQLCVVQRNGGAPLAGAGIRLAADGFFSEAYLDKPLCDIAAELWGGPSSHAFIEITTLVSASPFALFPLMAALLDYGRARGLTAGLFTITAPLRALFLRLGIPFTALVPARAERIGNAQSWGSYYEMDPWVCLMRDPAHAVFPRASLSVPALTPASSPAAAFSSPLKECALHG